MPGYTLTWLRSSRTFMLMLIDAGVSVAGKEPGLFRAFLSLQVHVFGVCRKASNLADGIRGARSANSSAC